MATKSEQKSRVVDIEA